MKHLKSFDQIMITLGIYKSFQTTRAAEREIATIGGTLQANQFTIISITSCWEKANSSKAELILTLECWILSAEALRVDARLAVAIAGDGILFR